MRGSRSSGTQQRVHHACVHFDGTAAIIDPDPRRTKLIDGIERGKAYG
ncbi:type I-E CRISPR-associated protein Cas6/Cse3/CasE [Streptomyces sp. NPDC051907]